MRRRSLKVLLTGTASDSHTWNLVYLRLFLEEQGHRVTGLGPCVPDDLLVAACAQPGPELVVISSVNGHGYRDGLSAVRALRAAGVQVPVAVGGKLGVAGQADPARRDTLLAAGCTAVFDDGDVGALRAFAAALVPGARVPAGSVSGGPVSAGVAPAGPVTGRVLSAGSVSAGRVPAAAARSLA
ncbi:cobalamin-dependent protein [Streptomyces sp. NPDC053755]|uniref:cobalamin B12-binding domain-containing protein n=1 Tax=Streptomyces sp. NPDC053755 TaxID=3155815 RepID=UPI003424B806